jgi:hypothetical protein
MSLGRRTQFVLAIAIVAIGSPHVRAENGRPSGATLSAMGLGGIMVLSDDEALAIRGQGYKGTNSIARAFGSSFADISTKNGDASSQNGYFAEGKHAAKGSNLSYAGVVQISSKPKKGGGHGGGDYGGPRRGKQGGGYGGGHGGHGGGKISIKATVVFAGGNSSAWSF